MNARVVRIETREGSRYLVCLRKAAPLRGNARLLLSEVQLCVVESAAAGATVSEIARALDRSPETIRDHLDAVFRMLRVSSGSSWPGHSQRSSSIRGSECLWSHFDQLVELPQLPAQYVPMRQRERDTDATNISFVAYFGGAPHVSRR